MDELDNVHPPGDPTDASDEGSDATPDFQGLELVDLTKRYGAVTAVRDFTARVERGETVAVLGPSGCGKSTVLLLVAGLVQPDAGGVRWDGESIVDVPIHRRSFGMMFQDFALFPHKDVAGNVAFGLEMAGWDPEDRRRRVRDVLELVGLEGLEGRDVATLSGGQQQRVALARALAPDPALLMLDEPLGSLDRTLRERLMLDLSRILAETGQTALYVTHDQEEAFAVGDRVILMEAGTVHQVGTPEALYREPASPYAARFLGLTNLVRGRTVRDHREAGPRSDDVRHDGAASEEARSRILVETPFGRVPLPEKLARAVGARPEWDALDVLLRPDSAELIPSEGQRSGDPQGSEGVVVRGRVIRRSFRGSETRIVIEAARASSDAAGAGAESAGASSEAPGQGSEVMEPLGVEPLEFVFPSWEIELPAVGAPVALRVPAEGIQVFPPPASRGGSAGAPDGL